MVGKFGVNAPKMISEFDKVDDKTVLVPFWYVKPTMDEELVNMQLEKEQCGSLELPCYVNTKDLEPGDLLLCESEMLAKKRKSRKESQVPLLDQLPKVPVPKKSCWTLGMFRSFTRIARTEEDEKTTSAQMNWNLCVWESL